MKQIIFLVLFSLAPASNVCFAQGDVYINEGETSKICGKYVTLDGIWLSGGARIADISVRENQNAKPITCGYHNHDTLQVSDKKNCTYFIHDIYKRGILTKGEIVISTEPAVMMMAIMTSIVSLSEGDDMYADKKYLVSKISAGKDGAGIVEIKISREDLDTTIYFKKGDVIWKEGFPFELTEISTVDKTCKFEEMKNYSYKTGDLIKGEDINKPPDEK
jgi:hypothetical protein